MKPFKLNLLSLIGTICLTICSGFSIVENKNLPSFEHAQQLYAQGKYDQCKSILELIIKEQPKHYKSIELLGDVFGQLKNWDEALKYYTLLKKSFPNEANYWYKCGGVLGMKAKEANKFKALGMIDDIKMSFEKAIVLNPNHIEARWALIELYLQLPGIVGGSEKKARIYANQLMQISKIDGYLAFGHIDEYFKRYLKAAESYQNAFEIGKSKTAFQKLYQVYYYKLKDYNKAKKLKEQFERS